MAYSALIGKHGKMCSKPCRFSKIGSKKKMSLSFTPFSSSIFEPNLQILDDIQLKDNGRILNIYNQCIFLNIWKYLKNGLIIIQS